MNQFYPLSLPFFSNQNRNWRILLIGLIWLGTYVNSYSQWQQATSNTTEDLNKVNYGGGQWVAVGNNGTIVTSSDGITWTPRTSTTTNTLLDVCYGGGQWVAIGNNGTILTSLDGISWTAQVSAPNQSLYQLNAISYNVGKWVASSRYGNDYYTSNVTDKILISTDGINWTSQTLSFNYLQIRAGNGKWVVNEGTQVRTSLDGISWQTTLVAGIRKLYRYSSYSNGHWILSGNYGSTLTSSDGVSWQEGIAHYWDGVFGVSYGDGQWVAPTPYGISVSLDGINWSFPNFASNLLSIEYNGSQWIGVGSSGTIVYNSNSTLPVSLVSFQGTSEGATARLTWETAWEKGASHFLIERSRDAKSFEAVGRVEAQGTTNVDQHYTFLNEGLASGLWYYRLRQVDLDATFTYSQIIAIRIDTDSFNELSLSPNPSSGLIQLETKASISSVRIYSSTGVLIHQALFNQAVNRWNWDGIGQSAGSYLIQVQTSDGKKRVMHWLKQ